MPKINGQTTHSLAGDKISEISDFNYEIFSDSFMNVDLKKQIDIRINYLQLKGISDTTKQDQINGYIKDTALEPYNKLFADKKNIEVGTECSIESSIVYLSNNIISIKFEGSVYTKGNAHGINIVSALNINLNTGAEITLDELFDEAFLGKLNYNVFKSVDFDIPADAAAIQNDIFDQFKNSLMGDNHNFYFGLSELTIVLPISNYFRFTADYEDLKECMKLDNPLWQEVLRIDISK
jgi:hypothetical protein